MCYTIELILCNEPTAENGEKNNRVADIIIVIVILYE